MYRDMVRIRKFEEKVYLLFLEGKVFGTIHQYQGQEAVAVGVCSALRREDCITSTHRPHGHCIAKGVPLNRMMAELFARADGCCKAKGGSMHMGDMSVGTIPAIAIVAGGVTIAAGMGLAYKIQKSDRVVACFFGDGAANKGAFHEGLNLAAIWKLPVVFVCENNLYGASTAIAADDAHRRHRRTRRRLRHPGPSWTARTSSPSTRRRAAAVEGARQAAAPLCSSARRTATVGHSRGDPGGYRSREEVEAWRERDPLTRMQRTC